MAKFDNGTANPLNISLFNQSISYLQSFSLAQPAISAFMMSNEVTVKFVYDGRMKYDPVTKVISFDPTAAHQVIQPNGSVGAQSPSMGLLHEIAHGQPQGHSHRVTSDNQTRAQPLHAIPRITVEAVSDCQT